MFKKQFLVLFSFLFLIATNNLSANDRNFDVDSLQKIEVSDESDDTVVDQLQVLARYADNPVATRESAAGIVELVESGQNIGEYDYLYLLYSLLRNAYPDIEGGLLEKDYISITDVTLDYLDYSTGTGIWVYTDIGQFQMEVYRSAGNGAGWVLRNSDPTKALTYIEQALEHEREEDTYLQDTYVRILLNLDRKDEAYNIVKAVLEEDQSFYDFQDFLSNDDYLSWLNAAEG